MRHTVGFLLRLALVWLVAVVLFTLVPQIERWMVDSTVATVRWAGSLVGVPSRLQDGLLVFGGSPPVNVVSECTALMPVTLLWSGILAYPAVLRWKLIGMAAGAAILWAYNLFRVVFLIAILGWDPKVWRFLHVYLWQTVTIGFACALFMLWLRRVPQRAAG